jgi:heme/copper-type cytochrome/quinol oxidase subunit 4
MANTDNVPALAFCARIVTPVVGSSLWIMANLNGCLMLPSELMNLHMHQ